MPDEPSSPATFEGLELPAGLRVVGPPAAEVAPVASPLAVVARAIDAPLGRPPLEEVARGARSVAVVIPDATRPAAAGVYLLPLLSRLTRAGLDPARIRLVVARGIHPATPRTEVARMLGEELVSVLRPIQSAPETPELNALLSTDPALGEVRVHRTVAEADLAILTGVVAPHHLAGYSGGPKALVPGVAERGTVLAAHRLTLDTLVAPDGSIRSAAGRLDDNPFYAALLGVARAHGRAFLLNVALASDGTIAAAVAGEVEAAHRAAARAFEAARPAAPPEPADLGVVEARGPRGRSLIQAHKALLEALAWLKPGAPVLLLADLGDGPGHPALLPWFEAGRLERHLAALRREFHPYGLTAYSLRRIARDHPVHVVSRMSRDLLRPMGLVPHAEARAALDFVLSEHPGVRTVARLTSG